MSKNDQTADQTAKSAAAPQRRRNRFAKICHVDFSDCAVSDIHGVSTLAFSAYVTRRQGQTGNELVAVTRQSRLIVMLGKTTYDLQNYVAENDAGSVKQPEKTEKQLENAKNQEKADVQAASTPVIDNSAAIDINSLPQEAVFAINTLREARKDFEDTLSAFEKGGTIQFTYVDIKINPVTTEVEKRSLAELRRVWEPYRGLIDTFLAEADTGKISRQTMDYLVRYTRLYNGTMTEAMIDSAQVFRDVAAYRAQKWQYMQITAIGIAFLLFLGIVFGALRQLLAGDRELAMAHQEMSEIMSSVNEGLFLVDKDLTIGSQYSRRLEEIIGQKDVGNKNLLTVLEPLVPKNDLDITQTFINQLYSDWVVEDLIDDLNPLHRISVQDEKTNATKFMDFKFFRVWLNDKIERVLVSVTDTTETVMLQASLDAQKEQEGCELEMLNIILNTNPVLLNNFIKGSMERLEEINKILKTSDTNTADLHSKVNYIARLVHTVKGESSSLKLSRIVEICETFEESLKVLKNSPNLTGQDFLGLVVTLEDLYRMFDVLNTYNARVGNAPQQNAAAQAVIPEQESRMLAAAQTDFFKQFVADIAKRNDKKAELVVQGFEHNPLTAEQWDKLKDIAIQLLRNAVVHGIETPEIRRQRNKPETGVLKLSLTQQPDGNLLLVAEDDGNGINFEGIRQKAVTLGLVTQTEAAKLEQRQLLKLMFSSGFSTAAQETEDAGRGVGMDIIKDIIQKMGGRIGVATAPESYTRFSMLFPKNSPFPS